MTCACVPTGKTLLRTTLCARTAIRHCEWFAPKGREQVRPRTCLRRGVARTVPTEAAGASRAVGGAKGLVAQRPGRTTSPARLPTACTACSIAAPRWTRARQAVRQWRIQTRPAAVRPSSLTILLRKVLFLPSAAASAPPTWPARRRRRLGRPRSRPTWSSTTWRRSSRSGTPRRCIPWLPVQGDNKSHALYVLRRLTQDTLTYLLTHKPARPLQLVAETFQQLQQRKDDGQVANVTELLAAVAAGSTGACWPHMTACTRRVQGMLT